MKNNETGEYELVVGNPQLLGGFVIVVLLCAAAFVMGYEVGQNTPHSAKPEADANAPAATQPSDARPPASPVSPSAGAQPSDANPAQTADDAAKPVEAPPQPTTQPAREAAAPAPTPPAPAPVHEEPAAPPASTAFYCQAMAVRQAADAQSLLQTLKDGGMPASLQTGADGWVRVMVGPYQDTSRFEPRQDRVGNSASRSAAPFASSVSGPLIQIGNAARPRLPGVGAPQPHALRIAQPAQERLARVEPAHRVRIGALPQYPRVFSPRRRHLHDSGQLLHARLRLLLGAEGQPGRARHAPRSRRARQCGAHGRRT